jgi:hypothetical protein
LFLAFVLLLVLGLFVVLPWLGQRGNLNYVIEDVISSMLDVPVRIDSIGSEPLGRLTLTRLRSVSADVEDRLRFSAAEISLRYDPVELLRGEIEEVRFVRPTVFINLDEDLSGLAFLPRFPQSADRGVDSPFALPFTLRRMVIENGEATVKFEGRDLPIDKLNIEIVDLGSDDGMAYDISARVLDAAISIKGRIDIVRGTDGQVRHRLPTNEIVIDGVRASMILPWLRMRDRGVGDADEDRLVERVDDLVHSAAFSLSGSLEGMWLEDMKLSLASTLDDVTAGDPESMGVLTGHVDIKLEARMYGLLERLTFRLGVLANATIATGQRMSDESGSIEVVGTLTRSEAEGTDIAIESASATLAGGGNLSVSGRIESILRDAGASLDLDVELRDIRTAKILEFLPEDVLSTFPVEITESRGEFDGEVDVTGTFAIPEASGRLRVKNAALRLPGTPRTFETGGSIVFEGLRVDRAGDASSFRSLEFSIDPFDAVEIGRSVESFVGNFPELSGSTGLSLRLEDASFSEEGALAKLRISAQLSNGSVELGDDIGELLGVEASADVSFGIDRGPRRIPVAAKIRLGIKELLLGDIYAELGDEPIELDVDGELLLAEGQRVDALVLSKFWTKTPITGPISGSVRFDRVPDSGEFTVSSSLVASRVPTARAFEVFVRDPYSNVSASLENAKLEGESSITLELSGSITDPLVALGLSLRDAKLTLGDLIVEGLSGVLPFRRYPRVGPTASWSRDATLSFEKLSRGPIEIPALTIRYRASENGYEILEPISFALFGGSVTIKSLVYGTDEHGNSNLRVVATGREISLEKVTRAYGWPLMPGTIRFDFTPLVYSDGGVDISGSLVVEAFGGSLTFTDLAIDDVLEPYGSLSLGEGRVQGMRLLQLGDALHFGLISGVLRGSITNLEFTSGEVTGFRLEAETVKTDGVPQYIDRRAIESIRTVLAGPLGAIEETFFSKFDFDRFGIECRLENETFYLSGKHREDGVDFLMSGRWYQFPRVSIVNARPDEPYDWSSILENLRAIYRGDFSLENEE